MSEFPYVGPPQHGLHEALSTARHRRLRKAGVSSGASALTLVLVAVLLGQTGRQTLVQQPTPEVPAITTITTIDNTPSGTAKPNTVAPGQFASGSTGTTASTPTTGLATLVLSPTGSTSRGAVRGPGAGVAGPSYKAGRITRSESFNIPTCAIPSSAATFCTSSQVTSTSAAHASLYADVCSADTNTRTLHYATANEVDFTIVKGNQEVWRWSRFHPPAGDAHILSVGTGMCTTWTFDWTRVDNLGNTVPAGDYTLRTTYACTEFARQVDTYDFTLS